MYSPTSAARAKGDHPPRAFPREAVQRQPDAVVVLPAVEPANHLPWRPFLPVHRGFGLQQPGKYAAFIFNAVHNLWV